MLKRWITGAFAVGSLIGSLALAACGSPEHVTRTETTEQTTTVPAMDVAPVVPPSQTTTTTTTVHGAQ
ncbi:MAG TPA: hypothetical protein VKZ79_00950 [Alphaproteobacteria bacterium]|nr:hypothetical protein [Alphaproteobacteria bacterium]